jgi:hypothetical protein
MGVMQSPTQTQEAATPTVAPTPPRSITTVGPDGKPQTLRIPSTRAEMRELLVQREELSDQLTNVSSRRRNLAEEIRNTGDGPTRAGLEDRLRLLDQRILQLETDLATTGRQLSSAPAELTAAATQSASRGGGDDFEEGLMIGGFSVLLFASIVFFFARRRWKRRAGVVRAQLGGDSAERLERLESGMDTIAIEIERISEGQRFVTKLLSESQLPLGTPQRIGQPASAERSPAKT